MKKPFYEVILTSLEPWSGIPAVEWRLELKILRDNIVGMKFLMKGCVWRDVRGW